MDQNSKSRPKMDQILTIFYFLGTDSSGRPQTPPLKTSRPVTPVGQPLGLPMNRAKLVPGRMSSNKLDNGRPRRDIPSTAV